MLNQIAAHAEQHVQPKVLYESRQGRIMDIRKKILSIVGVLALTMSMGTGIVVAQEEDPNSPGIGVTFIVACGTNNAGGGASTASIGRSDLGTGPVAFPLFDPATPGDGTVSTADNAFRVNVSLYCPTTTWSVTAAITDFSTQDTPPSTFSGSKFQLTSTGQWTTNGTTPAVQVAEPTAAVQFSGTSAPYTSTALAQATGTTTDASMYMDFTGQLVGLDDSISDGDYTAEITVTFNPNGL